MSREIKFLSHPSEWDWEEYAFGRLNEAKMARLDEHLLACTECIETLEHADSFVQMMRSAAPEIRGRRKSIFPSWLKLPVRFRLATVAAIVSISLILIAVTATWRSAPPGPLA